MAAYIIGMKKLQRSLLQEKELLSRDFWSSSRMTRLFGSQVGLRQLRKGGLWVARRDSEFGTVFGTIIIT
jgi:hypothetical protein